MEGSDVVDSNPEVEHSKQEDTQGSHDVLSEETGDDSPSMSEESSQDIDSAPGSRATSPTDYPMIAECLSKISNLEKDLENAELSIKRLEMELQDANSKKLNAVKEKEAMVMKYAVSEKTLIQKETAKESAEKKLKEVSKENEYLLHKIGVLNSEKTRIGNMYDNKCYELRSSQQELERVKSDLSALETKLKWTQNNLRTEIDLRKDYESKIDGMQTKVSESAREAEKAKKDALDAMKEFYNSQENRAHVLDTQLKDAQATLILLRHERDDKDQHNKQLLSELERLNEKQSNMFSENTNLSLKVQQLEKDYLDLQHKNKELQEFAEKQTQEAIDLSVKSSELEQIKMQLKKIQEQYTVATEEITNLKQRNADLVFDMESCRAHEAELLSFTNQLTEKNVRLQSEFTALETKVQQMTHEQSVLKRNAKEYETKASLLNTQLLEERSRFNEENNNLLEEIKVLRNDNAKLTQELADQQGENLVLKRKLEKSLKEVNKELAQTRKKLEVFENSGSGAASSSSSSTSLNAERDSCSKSPEPPIDQVQVVQPKELNRQTLIEHIVKLQRISARKSEKIDFLEEHVNTLVSELQKKSRLLQSYILREQSGTLSSNKMDSNKAHITQYSGIMASVYGAKVKDEHLTLELSLDINRKLQALLEDALLKNITLKENVDTLGTEIDRLLKSQNQPNNSSVSTT